MRILHTGDLHIDSAFGAYGPRDARKQREASRGMLRRVFECASEEKCNIILISGDLFDSRFIAPESEELFCSCVEKHNIPVVISPGNHDPYPECEGFYRRAQKRLGDKLFVFSSSELQVFDIDELRTRVYGYAFLSHSMNESPLNNANILEDNGYIKLLCAHADLSSAISAYCPLTLGDIRRFGFDYAALGHIHNRQPYEDAEGRIRYCGMPQGRSFDELGEGGVWIVDIGADMFECKRRTISEVSFHILDVDVSGCEDHLAVRQRICDKIAAQGYPKGARLRLNIEGRVKDKLNVSALEADCVGGLDYLEITDGTLPTLDTDYLERDITLRGELYRTLLPSLNDDNAEIRKQAIMALRIGLDAIDGRDIREFDE